MRTTHCQSRFCHMGHQFDRHKVPKHKVPNIVIVSWKECAARDAPESFPMPDGGETVEASVQTSSVLVEFCDTIFECYMIQQVELSKA